MPRKYRQKPAIVEAIQFDGTLEGVHAIENFVGHRVASSWWLGDGGLERHTVRIDSTWGTIRVAAGQWLTKDAHGVSGVHDPDTFPAVYEPVTEEGSNAT